MRLAIFGLAIALPISAQAQTLTPEQAKPVTIPCEMLRRAVNVAAYAYERHNNKDAHEVALMLFPFYRTCGATEAQITQWSQDMEARHAQREADKAGKRAAGPISAQAQATDNIVQIGDEKWELKCACLENDAINKAQTFCRSRGFTHAEITWRKADSAFLIIPLSEIPLSEVDFFCMRPGEHVTHSPSQSHDAACIDLGDGVINCHSID